MRNTMVSMALSTTLLLSGCGSDEEAGCPSHWIPRETNGAQVAVNDGVMILRAPKSTVASDPPSAGIQKAYVSGDFAVTIPFDTVTWGAASGSGALSVSLSAVEGEEYRMATGMLQQGTIQSSFTGGTAEEKTSEDVSVSSGSVTLTRTGGSVTVLVSSGGKTTTLTHDFPTAPAIFTLLAIGFDGSVTAKVNEISVTSGTALPADSFTCDSVH